MAPSSLWEELVNGHGPEAISQSDENALYLDLGSGYMGMYVSKNSLSRTLQLCTLFYVCEYTHTLN